MINTIIHRTPQPSSRNQPAVNDETRSQSIPLAELPAGEQAILVELGAGKMYASRMASLGFTPGVTVQMTQNYGRGPLVVTVRGTRVALGRSEAWRLRVRRMLE